MSLARRVREANITLTATNFLSVKGRVASALLQLAEGSGRNVGSGRILIRHKVSQHDLAAMPGVALRPQLLTIRRMFLKCCGFESQSGSHMIKDGGYVVRVNSLDRHGQIS